ncbi:FxLD family lanthipeptide [Streptomyces sp. DSM 42041]|uniref:FxLD family lanthipeptide n=1 Tax=Streptomyces hazeniae TaxID=3075538 RepID=A0ABU2NJV5_9ACTN|nr:FxLD family lanthipeptide [Streptomyces sp. DSM 42041]MDT0377203.1 FxLD family lanthipeptide [Streptomyces sp. DSM 42041]
MNHLAIAQPTQAVPSAVTSGAVDLDLDVSIVTSGPVSAALLSSTDDGCDTVRGGDC